MLTCSWPLAGDFIFIDMRFLLFNTIFKSICHIGIKYQFNISRY